MNNDKIADMEELVNRTCEKLVGDYKAILQLSYLDVTPSIRQSKAMLDEIDLKVKTEELIHGVKQLQSVEMAVDHLLEVFDQ